MIKDTSLTYFILHLHQMNNAEIKLLMMAFGDPAAGPRPVFVDLTTGKTTPLPNVSPGLWAMPAWR